MLVSFSVVPIGAGEELKELIAKLVPVIEKSGLAYKMGAMQTTLEGEPNKVMECIMACHGLMRSHAGRVLTHITIDDRQGAQARLEGKVQDVEAVLGRPVRHE